MGAGNSTRHIMTAALSAIYQHSLDKRDRRPTRRLFESFALNGRPFKHACAAHNMYVVNCYSALHKFDLGLFL